MANVPQKELETFENPKSSRDYVIEFDCPEFTCVCPKTGQPDFAHITIRYVPDLLCVELKSLKLYLWSFREEGHFHETVINRILDDLVAALQPREMRIEGDFNVRGGIHTTVTAQYP
ncbi:MAG: NADPH-dependent 7-cyano-7-deazaguanine reductase QueF [Acidobacteria bacterium]|uniref:NADPH-dependent 7-cyano-7-deazaguanine reductase n=1 Tax=Candidatus Polarisedimenticola svalbardensis TaxID=2886004 RepID=A0A8J6Y910_9BACT|nr:NADPH-dependent 7-cyano-7-deazaguanine reductase QueF [Candidatus Polarisedimenticola svalbardensis]